VGSSEELVDVVDVDGVDDGVVVTLVSVSVSVKLVAAVGDGVEVALDTVVDESEVTLSLVLDEEDEPVGRSVVEVELDTVVVDDKEVADDELLVPSSHVAGLPKGRHVPPTSTAGLKASTKSPLMMSTRASYARPPGIV
jgi:hypothetical protein